MDKRKEELIKRVHERAAEYFDARIECIKHLGKVFVRDLADDGLVKVIEDGTAETIAALEKAKDLDGKIPTDVNRTYGTVLDAAIKAALLKVEPYTDEFRADAKGKERLFEKAIREKVLVFKIKTGVEYLVFDHEYQRLGHLAPHYFVESGEQGHLSYFFCEQNDYGVMSGDLHDFVCGMTEYLTDGVIGLGYVLDETLPPFRIKRMEEFYEKIKIPNALYHLGRMHELCHELIASKTKALQGGDDCSSS